MMRTVMRPRYYCEFCKKAGGSPSHIKRHEAGCTNRADRVCGMCKRQGTDQTPIETLLTAVGDIEALREAAKGCPACMLTAIRLTKWPEEIYIDDYGRKQGRMTIYPDSISGWKFEEESKNFWARVNERKYLEGMRGYEY